MKNLIIALIAVFFLISVDLSANSPKKYKGHHKQEAKFRARREANRKAQYENFNKVQIKHKIYKPKRGV